MGTLGIGEGVKARGVGVSLRGVSGTAATHVTDWEAKEAAGDKVGPDDDNEALGEAGRPVETESRGPGGERKPPPLPVSIACVC
jgi:hypothetical protein